MAGNNRVPNDRLTTPGQSTAEWPTHALLVEDDALPCADLLDVARAYAAERPDHMFGLYVGRMRPPAEQQRIAQAVANASATAARWLPLRTSAPCWLVGYLMPIADIPNVITLADKLPGEAAGRVGAWHHRNRRVSYPWPSLVDHRDETSLVYGANRRPGRVAWRVRTA